MKPLKPLYKVLYYIVLLIGQVAVHLAYPVRVRGKKNLPKKQGWVLAPNHLHAVDPVFILAARGFRKKMLIMGKEELFEKNALLNFFWAIAGVFPVERGTGDKGLVKQAVDEVKNDRGMLIFPEGTRSKDGNLGRLKSGAFVIAMQAGVPMIPCSIAYKAGRPKPWNLITVKFGTPVTLEEMGLVGEYSAKKLRAAKQIFAQRLEQLRESGATA